MTGTTSAARAPAIAEFSPLSALAAAVSKLSPRIAARAPEIEAGRRLPPDLVEEFRSIGIFRMLVPRRLGGFELDFRASLDVLEALAIADASAAWAAMIGCHAPVLFSLLPRASFEAMYADGPDVIGGGSTRFQGAATKEQSGWRVSGRWGFASGCQHADWMLAFCVEMKDSAPIPGPAPGIPALRMVVCPAKDYRVIDNWDVVGLRGSGSHDIVLQNALVPDEFTYSVDFMSEAFCQVNAKAALHLGAVAVGIAEGALRDLANQALNGSSSSGGPNPLLGSVLAQQQVGTMDADVGAARAYLHAEAESLSRSRMPVETLSGGLQAASWISRTCTNVVDTCFALGGTTAIHAASPLQRRLRDIHTLGQHAIANPKLNVAAGARRFGQMVHPFATLSL